MTAKDRICSCSRRRDFIRAGVLSSMLGINLPRFLQLQAATATTPQPRAKAQACILLWLEGGPSHVDTWDPKPNSSFKPISTNVPGIQISSLMPGVARQMDKLAIIRSMRKVISIVVSRSTLVNRKLPMRRCAFFMAPYSSRRESRWFHPRTQE